MLTHFSVKGRRYLNSSPSDYTKWVDLWQGLLVIQRKRVQNDQRSFYPRKHNNSKILCRYAAWVCMPSLKVLFPVWHYLDMAEVKEAARRRRSSHYWSVPLEGIAGAQFLLVLFCLLTVKYSHFFLPCAPPWCE